MTSVIRAIYRPRWAGGFGYSCGGVVGVRWLIARLALTVAATLRDAQSAALVHAAPVPAVQSG